MKSWISWPVWHAIVALKYAQNTKSIVHLIFRLENVENAQEK